MTRFTIFATFVVAVSLACAPITPVPESEGDEGELAAEIALPSLGNHWLAEKPVGTSVGPVSQEMLAAGPSDPSRWLLYGGDYRNFRHSPLKTLTSDDASASCKSPGRFRAARSVSSRSSPVVYGGVMYVTSSYNRLFALDAKTGELLWRYDHPEPEEPAALLRSAEPRRGDRAATSC